MGRRGSAALPGDKIIIENGLGAYQAVRARRICFASLSMKKLFLPAVAGLLLLSGCASHYVLILTNGERITTKGKPKLVKNYFVYKDVTGHYGEPIPSGRVEEVSPASMATPSASQMFRNVSTK